MAELAEEDGTFALAARLAARALAKTRKLPHSEHRANAIDALVAAVRHLRLAREEWLRGQV